jgi:SAM-dependent methyltransferase
VTVLSAQRRSAHIQRRQQAEIERLSSDRAFAAERGASPEYACIAQWLKPHQGRVLELGCGPGRVVALLATLGFEVVGVDPYSFPTWEPLRKLSNVELRDGVRAEDLPFGDAAFDHIACLGTLLYFDDPDRALDEMRRVVRPGGRLVLRTVNSGNLYTGRTGRKLDPSSHTLLSLDELVGLVERHGFKVERRFANGFWPPVATNAWWYVQNVLLPFSALRALGKATPEGHRVNNVVLATAA